MVDVGDKFIEKNEKKKSKQTINMAGMFSELFVMVSQQGGKHCGNDPTYTGNCP